MECILLQHFDRTERASVYFRGGCANKGWKIRRPFFVTKNLNLIKTSYVYFCKLKLLLLQKKKLYFYITSAKASQNACLLLKLLKRTRATQKGLHITVIRRHLALKNAKLNLAMSKLKYLLCLWLLLYR